MFFDLRKSVSFLHFCLRNHLFSSLLYGVYTKSFACRDKVFGVGTMRCWGLGVVKDIRNVIPQNVNHTVNIRMLIYGMFDYGL